MEGQLIKGILIDTKTQNWSVTEITDDLKEFHRILDCELIDIVSRTVGGKCYDIVCDDEGNFKQDPVVTAFDSHGKPMLVGNLFICTYAGDGELGSLTDDDIEHIRSNLTINFVYDNGTVARCQIVVKNVEYS